MWNTKEDQVKNIPTGSALVQDIQDDDVDDSHSGQDLSNQTP